MEAINFIIDSKSVPRKANNSTVESCSMTGEAKELLPITDSKCRSLVEAKHSTVKSNDSSHFQTNSSPVEDK